MTPEPRKTSTGRPGAAGLEKCGAAAGGGAAVILDLMPVRSRVRDFVEVALRSLALRSPASASAKEAFVAYSAQRMITQCGISIIVSAAFALLWWPTDPWILGPIGGVVPMFALLRGIIVGFGVLYFLIVHVIGWRRHALTVFSVMGLLTLFAIGGGMSQLGGPDRPWLYFSYVFPFVTMALPLRPMPRLLLTAAFATANIIGILVFEPEHLHSEYAPMMLSFLLAVIFASVLAGNTLYLAVRDSFLQSRALARASAEVRDYCDHLEDKVADRTAELRRLLAHLETAREDERAFLSRELHDQLGQELTAQRYALANTRRRYAESSGAIARNLLELEDLQTRITATVRGIVTALRPTMLDDQGLRAALDWLVRQGSERAGLTGTLTIDGDEALLAGDQPIAVFRIVQESVTNAIRHADAQAITVTLRIGGGAIELTIADDGVGFDPDQPRGARGGGAGLIGMRERARALRGELTIERRAAGGTAVRLRAPLTAADPAEPGAGDVRPPDSPPAAEAAL